MTDAPGPDDAELELRWGVLQPLGAEIAQLALGRLTRRDLVPFGVLSDGSTTTVVGATDVDDDTHQERTVAAVQQALRESDAEAAGYATVIDVDGSPALLVHTEHRRGAPALVAVQGLRRARLTGRYTFRDGGDLSGSDRALWPFPESHDR